MSRKQTAARATVIGFYALFCFEILYMISPFALQFYSVYGPFLNFFHRWEATSWLTGFFLPHMAGTDQPLLNSLHKPGEPLFFGGSILFLIAFVQIYAAKLLRRGAVTGGLYRFFRHPQYLALAVAGLGMVIRWPRFFIAFSYAGMLVAYVLLARLEERACAARYGESYVAWLRTPPKAVSVKGGVLALAGAFLITAVITFGLREVTLSSIYAIWGPENSVISLAALDRERMQTAWRLAESSGPTPAGTLGYIVPEEWFMADLPLDDFQPEKWKTVGGHRARADFDRDLLKVLVAKPRTWSNDARGKEMLRRAWGLEPLRVVHVDLRQGRVVSVDPAPRHVLWGDIPTPLF